MKCSRWIALCVDVGQHHLVGMQVPPPPALDKNHHAQAPFAAWIDLLTHANWKPSEYNNKGRKTSLERGEFVAGRAYWSKRWNWTEKSVRGFFERLALDGMVEFKGQSEGHFANIATICNYEAYQTPPPAKSQSEGQSRASQGPDSYKDTLVSNINAGAEEQKVADAMIAQQAEALREAASQSKTKTVATETDVGNGVVVNCETIRHDKFVIDLKAIELQTFGSVPMVKIKAFAEGYARQWAAELAMGKSASSVLPTNITNTLRWCIHNNQTAEEIASIRKVKAAGGTPGQPKAYVPKPPKVVGPREGAL